MNIPSVGSKIRVEVENLSPMLTIPNVFPNIPKTLVYEGTVVRSHHWNKPNTFNMTTGDIRFPVRTISMQYVINIEYIERAESDRTSPIRTYQIPGSKGNVYTVTIDGPRMSCTCPQNQFRKQICKHIKQVLEGKNEQHGKDNKDSEVVQRPQKKTKRAASRKTSVGAISSLNL